ncbi:MAG: protein kinase domain-containing protein [Acidimicrobiia bacterium]
MPIQRRGERVHDGVLRRHPQRLHPKTQRHTVIWHTKGRHTPIPLRFNYLHSKGHFHRDISYKNILIEQYDRAAVIVKLSDFGLTKLQTQP